MMAGGNGKWLLVFAMFLVAAPARAQAPAEGAVELTPFVGYRWGGELGDVENGGSASVAEGSSYGIMLDWEVAKDAFVELRYSRQETELEATGSSFGPGNATITDLKVEHYFLGGTYQWESQGPFRPFVGADLGVIHFSPSGSGSETRFAFSLGGGVKAPLAKHLGLRFDGRWVINRISGDTEFYCSSTGQCLIASDGTFFNQIEVSGGLTFKF